ncbi:HYD1 signature containing ADP-ribosyltransferase family protein [Enterobacter roggenkampii]
MTRQRPVYAAGPDRAGGGDKSLPVCAECAGVGGSVGCDAYTLINYTTEEGMKGITESGVIRPSSGDIHACFGDGQYFTNIRLGMIGGRTLQDIGGAGKMSLGQLAADIYGDVRKLKGISHFVEIDVTGLYVIEPRESTFLILNTKDLDVSKRIIKSVRNCG